MNNVVKDAGTMTKRFLSDVKNITRSIGMIEALKKILKTPPALVFIFWTLFTLTNSVADAVRFYRGFEFFGEMRLWHILKFFWLGFAVMTGFYCRMIFEGIFYNDYGKPKKKRRLKYVAVFVFLLVWFCVLRWVFHEAFMDNWRN